MKNAYILFCSPAGSTGHVARVMAESLEEKSVAVHLLNLGTGEDSSRFIELLKAADADDCLFVGSPMYRELAVPPVINFLGNVPTADGCRTVPFVTWGGATSGIALWQMGQVLHGKGYTPMLHTNTRKLLLLIENIYESCQLSVCAGIHQM